MSNFTAAAVYGMLSRQRAQTVTLRRLGNSPPDDVSVLAKIDDLQAMPLAGNMAQTQRHIVISDYEIQQAGWPGPPKRLDQIITLEGKTMTVQAADPVIVGDETIMHNLTTLGG